MGHQFPRAAVAATVALAAACGGGSGDAAPAAVLDNARQQVVSIAASDSTVDPPSGALADELPAPDPSTFVGANRVVNLWVGPDGAGAAVDVWGRRTFSNGPVLLAADISFGEASTFAGAPANYELSIVGAGAGADGVELADVINAADRERVTTVFVNDDRTGGARSFSLWEQGSSRPSAQPGEGFGLVRLVAVGLDAVDADLIASVGADSFTIGDGDGNCRPERGTAGDGVGVATLAAGGDLEFELEPGLASMTLHPQVVPGNCAASPLAEVAVDVVAGATAMVLAYSRDGSSIGMLALPAD